MPVAWVDGKLLGSSLDVMETAAILPMMQLFPLLLQGPPGLKGEQGDTVVIDYDGRILDALKVRVFLVGPGCTLYVHF